MYSLTIAGKHGHIAPIINEISLVRKLNKTEYLHIPSGEIFKYRLKETKDIGNLLNAKQKCIDIIHTNVRANSIFLTLTTQANCQDRDLFFSWLAKFCRTDVFLATFGNKYLYTVEKQKRGALHSHFICFNPLMNFIPYRPLITAWREVIGGIGSVKVLKIDDPDNIGKYVAKYILKEFASVEKYKRVYIPSKYLIKPEKYAIDYRELKKYLSQCKEKKAIIEGEKKIVGWYW
jgi:hypothetical protein